MRFVHTQEADRLKEALRSILAEPGSTAAQLQQVAGLALQLHERLQEAVTEARAFATQQVNDLATLKRGPQVRPVAPGGRPDLHQLQPCRAANSSP